MLPVVEYTFYFISFQVNVSEFWSYYQNIVSEKIHQPADGFQPQGNNSLTSISPAELLLWPFLSFFLNPSDKVMKSGQIIHGIIEPFRLERTSWGFWSHPLLKAGSILNSDQVTDGFIHPGLLNFQGERSHNHSGPSSSAYYPHIDCFPSFYLDIINKHNL